MIAEIFLGLIAIAELIAFGAYVYLSNKEKAKLINALISKQPSDYINATLADHTKIETPKVEEQDIAIEDIPDDKYIDIVTKGTERI